MPVSTSVATIDAIDGIQDDEFADLIKSLTPEEAEWLWLALVQKNPRLAE
jgi:hypothetical protein